MATKDTHKTVKNLIESGFTEKQAETVTSVIQESLESKKTKPAPELWFCLILVGIIFWVWGVSSMLRK